jgi:nicotinate-nucleotide pyrophosphorylase (carboxylating)
MDIKISREVENALLEDAPWGDITSKLTIDKHQSSIAHLTSKSDSVACGHEYFLSSFKLLDETISIETYIPEGNWVKSGEIVMTVKGNTRAILQAERVGLNYFCHMSGIATEVRKIATLIGSTDCKVVDTRKTLPHLRLAQKHAVEVGGGINHRMDLSSAILIKDNHICAVGNIYDAVSLAKDRSPHTMNVEVEVTDIDQARSAIDAGADILLLDNMTPEQIEKIIEIVPDGIKTEASGGITPLNCKAYAETGVDTISMGYITHSVKSADFSLEFEHLKINP